jgi:hypothetical protein
MIVTDEDIESDEAVADPLPDRVTWRADEDNDAAVARARRRLEMAHALAEMSLRMAGAVEARAVAAMAAEAPAPDPLFGDVGLVFTRVMRAARLSLALEARIDAENYEQGYGRTAEAGEDPDDPIVFRQTRSQKIEVEEKLIQRLVQRRRGDIYDIVERVLRAEAREVGREGEVERMLVNVGLGRELEDMSRGDDSYINHNIGDQVIEVCERVGLPIGQVFTVPPEHRARGSAPPFKDRDHPS